MPTRTGPDPCRTPRPLAAADNVRLDAKLAEMLKKHPDADADKDGKLTRGEAKTYMKAHRNKQCDNEVKL